MFASTFRPVTPISPRVPSTSYSSDNLESISVSTDVSYLLSNLSNLSRWDTVYLPNC
jgi:hypothetical protein